MISLLRCYFSLLLILILITPEFDESNSANFSSLDAICLFYNFLLLGFGIGILLICLPRCHFGPSHLALWHRISHYSSFPVLRHEWTSIGVLQIWPLRCLLALRQFRSASGFLYFNLSDAILTCFALSQHRNPIILNFRWKKPQKGAFRHRNPCIPFLPMPTTYSRHI